MRIARITFGMAAVRRATPLIGFGLVATLAGACTEYGFKGKADGSGGGDGDTGFDPGTDTDFSDLCDGLVASPHDVALNTECDVDLQTGGFTPVVEYHYGTTSFCGPPGVGQIVDSNGSGAIDSDDMPAIVVYQGGTSGMGNGNVVAVKGDGSGEYWRSSRGIGQDGGFSIADLDGDGWPEVVAAGTNKITALDGRTGRVTWTSPPLTNNMDPLGYNYPAVSDMDGDGKPEVTVGNAILNGVDGSIRGQGRQGKGAAPYGGTPSSGSYGTLSVPIDLDGDGKEELVTGNAAYKVDGTIKWQNGGLDGLIAVADFDGDGQGEIVKTSGIYVTGMESDGTEVWGPVVYSGNLGAPAIDDLDGDGTPDIVFAAQNSLIAMEWGGTVKWTASISDSSGAAGPVLFDFDQDGYPEVLYADETSVRFFSGIDGSVKLISTEHGSYTILETPVVADVDNDDQAEIILGHCSWNKSFSVYGDASGSWPPGRKTWNQHAYTITNIGDQGEIQPTGSTNFSTFNSFRSGDPNPPPGDYTDLQAEVWDVCETECDDGKVYVGAWVMNAGNIEVPAGVPLSITAGPGGPVLATQLTTTAIPSGKTGEALIFALSPDDLGSAKPYAVADADGSGSGVVYECNEDNNLYDWSSAVCQD